MVSSSYKMVSSIEKIDHSERSQENNGSQGRQITVLTVVLRRLRKSHLIKEVIFGQRLRSSGEFNDVVIWRKSFSGEEITSAKVLW